MTEHSKGKKAVLVLGSGGREHALAWKLSQSLQVGRIIVAPGNAGMPSRWERWFDKDHSVLAQRAREEKVDLVVIGPDNDLAAGAADTFTSWGVPVFGPSQRASKIESSKNFAKEVMVSAGVPTARYAWVCSVEEGLEVLRSAEWIGPAGECVVKADGLALGKGVQVCSTLAEAKQALSNLISVSGALVIEEKIVGEELSWMAFCDGEYCSLLEPARDYKRLLTRDQGPNTGGMGAVSPVPRVPPSWFERVREEVFIPALKEMKRRGNPFKGLLYAGLMVDFTKDRFWVLEFNARFGDPETQVLLPRMEGDFYSWCEAVAEGRLERMPRVVPFLPNHAVVVVAASSGYPQSPQIGEPLTLEEEEVARPFTNSEGSSCSNPKLFFAGVRREGNQLVTSGGRVVGVLGTGSSFAQARASAYTSLGSIQFRGKQFREDIGAALE